MCETPCQEFWVQLIKLTWMSLHGSLLHHKPKELKPSRGKGGYDYDGFHVNHVRRCW